MIITAVTKCLPQFFFYSLMQLTTGTINKLFNKLANQLSSGFFFKEINLFLVYIFFINKIQFALWVEYQKEETIQR